MKRGNSAQQFGIIAASEVALTDGAPSRRVKLLPIGTVAMRDGRGPFLVRDKAHAETIVAATQEWLGGARFNFDYDHQTVYAVKPGVGGTAIAAGWASADRLTAEDDGIYINDVEWTPAAEQKLRDQEYRYTSPLFLVSPANEVLRLRNAALVNVGAIDLPAVAAGLSEGDDHMNLTAIAAALGLASTATAEEIAAAATALKAKSAAPATSAIAIAAGLADSASVEEIAAAVTAIKTSVDPAQFVPVADVQKMHGQIATLTDDLAKREVAAAMDEGKVSPALEKWALNEVKTNRAGWDAYLAGAPVIIAAGAQLDGGKPGTKATSLTADEIAACEMTGTSHEDFLAAKNEGIA